MAPVRRHRPMHTTSDRRGLSCPFCPGAEDQTPPEIEAERGPDGRWHARAFDNLYPASAVHEVVAEGHHHAEHPADLDLDTWRAVIRLWQRRVAALETRPDVGCTFLFKNVGAFAGASIAHNHSQVIGLPEPPPRIQLEAELAKSAASCPWCDEIATAAASNREILTTPNHVALCPSTPKMPLETWLLPRDCADEFLTTDVDSLAQALHRLFFAVAAHLDRPALNFWLHRLPGAEFHWHFELQPRTGQVAGLEIGGDMYINSFPPAQAARDLRNALPN